MVLTGFGLLSTKLLRSILGVDQECHFQLYNSMGKKEVLPQKETQLKTEKNPRDSLFKLFLH